MTKAHKTEVAIAGAILVTLIGLACWAVPVYRECRAQGNSRAYCLWIMG